MSVREIMIKDHFVVTLVVSTGQTHNFGNLRPAIPWSPIYRLLIPYIKPSVRESMIKSHWAPGLTGVGEFNSSSKRSLQFVIWSSSLVIDKGLSFIHVSTCSHFSY